MQASAKLKALVGLEELSIGGTAVTDAGLVHLRAFPRLRTLSIYGTPLTDAGMDVVASLDELEEVALAGTRITDAGLMKLAKSRKLSFVQVGRGTATTEAGIAALKAKVPGLTVRLWLRY